MDLHDKIAVAACHLEEGRASSIFCASALQAASALPLQRYHWARSIRYSRCSGAARCRIARVVKLGWLLQDKVAILLLCSGRQGRPFCHRKGLTMPATSA